MARPIYCDIDGTAIHAIVRGDEVVRIVPRPGVSEFLKALSRHGDLFVLSHAMREHVDNALEAIGPASGLFSGILSREDLAPVIEQLDVVLSSPGLSDRERDRLYREIPPIAPRGPVFDDFSVGSYIYALKSAAVGIDERHWIQVERFSESHPDRDGLIKAYREYRIRFVGGRAIMSGVARRIATKAR